MDTIASTGLVTNKVERLDADDRVAFFFAPP